MRAVSETSGTILSVNNIKIRGVQEENIWENIGNYSGKVAEHGKGISHPILEKRPEFHTG